MTDALLPLSIDPVPDRLVRVLVGRLEFVTPEVEAVGGDGPAGPRGGRLAGRVCDAARLLRLGRFLEPQVRNVLRRTNGRDGPARADERSSTCSRRRPRRAGRLALMSQPVPGPVPAPTTALLFAAAQGGDRGAFAELYRRFAGVVHGIALARVGPADADDVAQETFLVMHRRLSSVREAEAFPGWICTVARRAATDRLRRRKRHAHDPLPDAPVGARRSRTRTRRCGAGCSRRSRRLPEAYREPLILRLVEGLTGPDIAARTGRTPGSVRVNLHRGMALLRPRLEQDGW